MTIGQRFDSHHEGDHTLGEGVKWGVKLLPPGPEPEHQRKPPEKSPTPLSGRKRMKTLGHPIFRLQKTRYPLQQSSTRRSWARCALLFHVAGPPRCQEILEEGGDDANVTVKGVYPNHIASSGY